MIKKIHYPKLRTSELLQFIYDAIEVCNNNDVTKLQVSNKITELLNANKQLDSSFKIDQSSAISSELVELDQRRDACITGIRLNAESWSYHFDPSRAKNANLILKSIDKYGSGITRFNYQAETSIVSSIMDGWSTNNELSEAMNSLQLSAWAAELKLTNDLFNKAYIDRINEKSQNIQSSSSLELRQVVITYYKDLCSNIEARSTLSLGSYDTVISQLNILTTKYNQLVDNRSSAQQKNSIS